jgi:hypothetical protein
MVGVGLEVMLSTICFVDPRVSAEVFTSSVMYTSEEDGKVLLGTTTTAEWNLLKRASALANAVASSALSMREYTLSTVQLYVTG